MCVLLREKSSSDDEKVECAHISKWILVLILAAYSVATDSFFSTRIVTDNFGV